MISFKSAKTAVVNRTKKFSARLNPNLTTWQSIGRSFECAAWIVLLLTPVLLVSQAFALASAIGVSIMVLATFLGALLIKLILEWVARVPTKFRFALMFLILTTLPVLGGASPAGMAIMLAWLIVSVMLFGGALSSIRQFGVRWFNGLLGAIGLVGLVSLVTFLAIDGWEVEEDINLIAVQQSTLTTPHPNEPGSHEVEAFTYGPGTDRHRDNFGEAVNFVSASVDGRKLLDGWEGGSGWLRTRFWGIGPDELPIRGQGHFPSGVGPFPVVLVVHGNHLMEDFSDGGYTYLTEHFASRGIISISVDENFLNTSLGDTLSLFDGGLDEENDARGWLLLKHLSQLKLWNEDSDHAWHGKIDLNRVVLIGHSRGGEAVSEAAVFNTLSAYPDDATLPFDFNFGLKGIVAIAPVDNQYHPRNRDTIAKDVNFLVIHGSHDGDVTSYAGSAMYARLKYDSCTDCFKAGIYLVGANHGQFNTSWGKRDFPLPMSALLNLQPIMPASAQQSAAKAVITSFLEATLHANERYENVLASPSTLSALLPPNTRFLNQFRAASDIVIADFEEDAEVTTGANRSVITTEHLKLWHETEIKLKWADSDTMAVAIGWHSEEKEEDAAAANYTLTLDQNLPLEVGATLTLSLAQSTMAPLEVESYEPPDEIDFSVVLTDGSGVEAAVPLSQIRPLSPDIKPSLYKMTLMNSDARSETVFQHYRFPIANWQDNNPAFDPTAISEISLQFDKTDHGVVLLQEILISP